MRKLLRLFLIAGIVAFAVGMTAFSCGKTADPPSNNNNNANNNSGGSGGDGNGGGGTPAPQPSPVNLVITNLDVGAKVKGDTIYLNAMGFPNDRAMWTRSDFAFMSSASATQRSKLFEVVITGGVVGDAAATGGLVVASYGNKDKFADMNITGSSIGAAQQGLHDPMNIAMTSYYNATGTDLWSGLGAGVSIFSAFTDDTTTPGYSFGTLNPTDPTDANKLKPIFFCSTTLSDVKAQVTANVPTTTKLTGGQKAICWMSTAFNTFINTASPPALIANGTQWLAAAETTTFKKTIEVTFAGIRTDAKTVVDIGLPGATDVAKATAFSNGLTKAEMTALAGANPTGAKKYKISIVGQTVFDGL